MVGLRRKDDLPHIRQQVASVPTNVVIDPTQRRRRSTVSRMDIQISLDDVDRAAGRLLGVAHRTPVMTSTTLNQRVGAEVFLKAENLQRMGAFKFRGAFNAIAALDPAVRARGVASFSSGNHAQAVALAASLHEAPAVILMPETLRH